MLYFSYNEAKTPPTSYSDRYPSAGCPTKTPYAALAQDALDVGYTTPGSYALALVRTRGEVPPPILEERTEERFALQAGRLAWLLYQFEAQQAHLATGLAATLVTGPAEEPAPRSWLAQQRAIAQAARRQQ